VEESGHSGIAVRMTWLLSIRCPTNQGAAAPPDEKRFNGDHMWHTAVTDACGFLRIAGHGTTLCPPGLAFYLDSGGLAGRSGTKLAGVRIPLRARSQSDVTDPRLTNGYQADSVLTAKRRLTGVGTSQGRPRRGQEMSCSNRL